MSEGDTIPMRGSADMWRSRAKAAEAENQRLQAEVARLTQRDHREIDGCCSKQKAELRARIAELEAEVAILKDVRATEQYLASLPVGDKELDFAKRTATEAALRYVQEEPVSNADELVALRAKLQEAVGIAQKFADAARDACIAGLAQSAKLRQAEVRIAELEALVRLLKADAADGTANQHYLDGAEAFADWAAEDNDFPSTDASFEDWKDRGLRAADRSGSALLGEDGNA